MIVTNYVLSINLDFIICFFILKILIMEKIKEKSYLRIVNYWFIGLFDEET